MFAVNEVVSQEQLVTQGKFLFAKWYGNDAYRGTFFRCRLLQPTDKGYKVLFKDDNRVQDTDILDVFVSN